MPVYGDKNILAISCKIPGEIIPGEHPLIRCHYLIAGDLIGNEGEPDLLGTCAAHLERSRNKIVSLQVVGHEPVFAGLTDIEALNLVRKSNQLEEEFEPQFMHLPQQPESFWYAHKLWLAESTDKAEVIVFNYHGKLKVVKQSYWEESCLVKSALCDFDAANKAFYDCLNFLKDAYPRHLSWLQP